MAASLFHEKAIMPNDSMVAAVLNDKKEVWDLLESHIISNYKYIKKEWKFYSKKSGWSLLFKDKRRTLLYIIPFDGYFKAWFVLSEKAVATAKNSALPKEVLKTIRAAASYVEGTLFDVDVKSERDLLPVFALLQIKAEM